MTNEELKLLSEIRTMVSEKPEFLTHIINACVAGVYDREKAFREMASDMETFASAMCFLVGQNRVSPKLKEQMSELALSKLQKYYGKSFLKWDHSVAEKDI